MESCEVGRAVEAAGSTASALGLQVDDSVVINDSNRVAVRLMPCDVLARVAPSAWGPSLQLEAEVAHRLSEFASPVGGLEPLAGPRVYARDGFAITLWAYYEPVAPPVIALADYADALIRLHVGLRQIDLEAPHITDRVAATMRELGDTQQTPELLCPDRELLTDTLSRVSARIQSCGADEQLLHGDAWSGNLLSTRRGPLFVDLHDCCRGPVEYDIANAPEGVGELYPGVNQALIQECRILMRALTTACRWRPDDEFPNRDYWRVEGLNQLRVARARLGWS